MNTKYIVLFLYFGVLLGIGFLASKKIKNISDYYVGGKRLVFGLPHSLLEQLENLVGC